MKHSIAGSRVTESDKSKADNKCEVREKSENTLFKHIAMVYMDTSRPLSDSTSCMKNAACIQNTKCLRYKTPTKYICNFSVAKLVRNVTKRSAPLYHYTQATVGPP